MPAEGCRAKTRVHQKWRMTWNRLWRAVWGYTKVTIRPRFSRTDPEIRPMARTDLVPDLLNQLMQSEKQGTKMAQSVQLRATGYGVAHQLRWIDYQRAEPRNTWKSASYVQGGGCFAIRNFVSKVQRYYNSAGLHTLATLCAIRDHFHYIYVTVKARRLVNPRFYW
jgi:hypothetical protein